MIYRFGPFEFDPGERRLLRDGEDVHLQPKTFETLALLVEKRGLLVTKDELMASLWPEQVVTEHSLTRCIREVRKALGDEASDSRFVETVPKAGYRFVAEVKLGEPVVSSSVSSNQPAAGSRPWPLLVAVLAGGLVWLLWGGPREQAPVQPVLAIAPFENHTDDIDNDLVLRGLVDDIRERMSGSGQVVVVSGGAPDTATAPSMEADAWPEWLEADWLLLGDAREDQKHRFVRLQLLSARHGLAWEEEVRIASGDLLGLAENITARVAESLGLTLPALPRYLATAASVEAISAQHQYLLARGLIAQRNFENLARAIQLLHQVLELKPDHAGAMAALGIAYILSPDQFYPTGVAFQRADGLFDEALEINPDLALAWAGKALSQIAQDGDLDMVRENIDRALSLNPYDADVLAWAANLAGSEGRINDAFDYLSRALRIDPLHTTVAGNLAFNLGRQGRYEQAQALLENTETRLGNHHQFYYFKVSLALASGDLRFALEQAQQAHLDSPRGLFFAGQLARVYSRLQMKDEAYDWISSAKSVNSLQEQYFLAALEVAARFGDTTALVALADSLRAHPGFEEDAPEKSQRWLLEQLLEIHGWLSQCEEVIELAEYRLGGADQLEGKRGSTSGAANLAHWVAFCLQQTGNPAAASGWLETVASQISFMKLNGLGPSTPDMYIEAQNLVLRGQSQEAMALLAEMIQAGWLDEGALRHDPRWKQVSGSEAFLALLAKVADRTSAIRQEVIDAGQLEAFEAARTEAAAE